MKWYKSLLLGSVLSIGFLNTQPVEANEADELDTFLLEKGVPISVVEDLTTNAKENIYVTLDDDSAEYKGYDKKENVNMTGGTIQDEISVFSIPQSELSMSVVGFENADGTQDVYPSFQWNATTRLSNDTFGFVVNNSDWSTIAGDVGMRVVIPEFGPEGGQLEEYIDRATESSFAGHAIKMNNFLNQPFDNPEGNAHFSIEPNGSGASQTIILRYADDPTSGGSLSYSATIQSFGISYTPNTDIREGTETLSW